MITYENVSKIYNGITAVDNLNLTVNAGEFVVLIGPSGCGKTTSLKMVNKLINIDKGNIYIENKNIKDINGVELRRKIGYVIQQIGLFPNMTIEQNILVVPKLLKWSKEKCSRRVHELLELVGMPYEENAKKYPNELSGGQQQRIGVLRALAGQPPIILMDEPFGALDPVTRENLQDEFKILQKKLNKTIIFVTHDMEEAIKMADRIVFMFNGKILQVASPEDMINNPADPIISEFMGKFTSNNFQNILCKDIMKRKVLLVKENEKIEKCISTITEKQLNSIIVVDSKEKFKGIVRINTLKENPDSKSIVSDSVDTNLETVLVNNNVKDAFVKLNKIKDDYIVVLNHDKTVAGIITKNHITKALANIVWGDLDWAL